MRTPSTGSGATFDKLRTFDKQAPFDKLSGFNPNKRAEP